MQAFYPERFEREMGCTEPEWLGWLPNAMGDVPWQRHASSAKASIGAGSFEVHWRWAVASWLVRHGLDSFRVIN